IALGATVKATSPNGSRVIPLDEFFTDYYETSLKPDEIITELFVPRLPTNAGGAYLKFLPRTTDDYATVSSAAVLTFDKYKKNKVKDHKSNGEAENHDEGANRHRSRSARPARQSRSIRRSRGEGQGSGRSRQRFSRLGGLQERNGRRICPARPRKSPRQYSSVSQSQTGKKKDNQEDQEKEEALKFTQSAQIPVAREPLWNFLMDVPKVAQSLPGVESVSKIDDTTYQGALKVRVGPIALNLQGKIIVEEQDHQNWRAALRAEAKDRMAAGAVNGKTSMVLKELSADQTELLVETDVSILGKIGEFGQPIIRKKADAMLKEFVENIKKQLTGK